MKENFDILKVQVIGPLLRQRQELRVPVENPQGAAPEIGFT